MTAADPQNSTHAISASSNTAAGPGVPEVIYVSEQRIACDGGGGALGHPKVWYSLEDGVAECGYCGRRFIFREQ